jgi:hypothetical protein
MKKFKREDAMPTYSRVDLNFLKETQLPTDKAVRVESIKSDLSERTIRRQIRNACAKGHDLAHLLPQNR